MNLYRSTPFVLAAVIAGVMGISTAMAKGNEDNPTVVQIDPSVNDVDATINNEVEIKNDAGAALAVDTGAASRIPFVLSASGEGDDDFFTRSFSVPEDHYFVIEYVSALHQCFSNCIGLHASQFMFHTGGTAGRAYFTVNNRLPERDLDPDATDVSYFTISESVRIYANPGSEITYQAVSLPFSTKLYFSSLTVSGYLIPLEEPSLAP